MGELYRSLRRLSGNLTCSHQGGMKCIRTLCQLMERCDGHWGDVKVLGEV